MKFHTQVICKLTIVKLTNYDSYQSSDKVNDKQKTSKWQAGDKQVTTNKNEKKKKKKKNEESKHKHWEYLHILLTDKERDKLMTDYWETVFDLYLKKVDEYIQIKGASYKDHNLVMRNWINRDNVKKDEWKKGFEKTDQNWNEWL